MTRVTSPRNERKRPRQFVVLAYRMPPKPTASRVAVWRALKKSGAVYIQDSVCVVPDTAAIRRELAPVLARIDGADGHYHLLPLRTAPSDEQAKLIDLFLEQSAQHCREIIENCEVDFATEIEFGIFRETFTYEEAEEVRMQFEKLVTWFGRVTARDWFGAPNRAAAAAWIDHCELLLEDFETKVFQGHA
jgi:hypothetical protein